MLLPPVLEGPREPVLFMVEVLREPPAFPPTFDAPRGPPAGLPVFAGPREPVVDGFVFAGPRLPPVVVPPGVLGPRFPPTGLDVVDGPCEAPAGVDGVEVCGVAEVLGVCVGADGVCAGAEGLGAGVDGLLGLFWAGAAAIGAQVSAAAAKAVRILLRNDELLMVFLHLSANTSTRPLMDNDAI